MKVSLDTERMEAELLEEKGVRDLDVPKDVQIDSEEEKRALEGDRDGPLDANITSKAEVSADTNRTDSNENATPLPSNSVEPEPNIPEEKMELDDPEIFGPFTKSQLEPNIQTDADQGHLDCFIENMSMLKAAIGMLTKSFLL